MAKNGLGKIPWWGWVIGGVVVIAALPFVTGMLMLPSIIKPAIETKICAIHPEYPGCHRGYDE